MLQDEYSCKYCPQLNVCTMYHKSVEKGDNKSARMGNLFDKSTSHLSAVHLKYFSQWNELIALEYKAMQVFLNSTSYPGSFHYAPVERAWVRGCLELSVPV